MSTGLDSLPLLDDERPPTGEQIESFRRDGFVRIPGLCDPDEVAAYRDAIADATATHNREQRPLDERDTYGRAFLQTLQLRKRDERVMRFCTSRRFGRCMADLLGVDGVRIYHDQSLCKEPGGGHTPWHQDLYYWPFDEVTVGGMWMPLVDVSVDMGGLRYARGTHNAGFLGHHQIGDESDAVYDAYIAEHSVEVVECAPVRAGDALFHTGWTVHGAGPNRSGNARLAMVVAYFADGMRVGAITNPNKEHDRRRFLGGCEPGSLAAGPHNTLVYSRP